MFGWLAVGSKTMDKREQLEAVVKRSPIDALGLILAGEFDGVPEAETVKAMLLGDKIDEQTNED